MGEVEHVVVGEWRELPVPSRIRCTICLTRGGGPFRVAWRAWGAWVEAEERRERSLKRIKLAHVGVLQTAEEGKEESLEHMRAWDSKTDVYISLARVSDMIRGQTPLWPCIVGCLAIIRGQSRPPKIFNSAPYSSPCDQTMGGKP